MFLLWFLMITFFHKVLNRNKTISRRKEQITIIVSLIITAALFFITSSLFVIFLDKSFNLDLILENEGVGSILYDISLITIFTMSPFLITWTATKLMNQNDS
jgi:hypothetical protein